MQTAFPPSVHGQVETLSRRIYSERKQVLIKELLTLKTLLMKANEHNCSPTPTPIYLTQHSVAEASFKVLFYS
jgi:hypothetical protein